MIMFTPEVYPFGKFGVLATQLIFGFTKLGVTCQSL